MKEQTLSLIRHILTFGGGPLVAKGVISAGFSTELVGLLVSLIGTAWGIIDKQGK